MNILQEISLLSLSRHFLSLILVMTITVTGTVEKKDIGTGTWALVTKEGTTYELKDAPQELQKASGTVEVKGQIRDDIMTFAAIGPVLEVKSFKASD
jgi:hypothetical protein